MRACIMLRYILTLILTLTSLRAARCRAAEASFSGQASAWGACNGEELLGARYIPEVKAAGQLPEEKKVDAELSLNLYTWAPVDSLTEFEDNAELKLYRAWLRYSAPQYEARLGLQKINFGPARLLRSLMWFDQLDPRDPLQLTDGVYALLGRYYFLNNANIWIWGLYGSDDLKGLELVETDEDRAEFGGRCQYPVGKGEMALSFNRRYVDAMDWAKKMSGLLQDGAENRYALDGTWDVGVGLWFEASLEELAIDTSRKLRRKFLTIGSDYTFETGIHLLGEHLIHSTDSDIDSLDGTKHVSALSLDYRLGIMDSVNAICYYDWDNDNSFLYLGWQRTYDNWKIDVIAFSNPEDELSLFSQGGPNVFSGDGVQLILTYNH